MNKNIILLVLTLCIIAISCKKETGSDKHQEIKNDTPLFTEIGTKDSGIDFKNIIHQTNEFNFMNYMYIYTGAGVAVGDIDNDGLDDIYLVSNFSKNKLYKNKGNFSFEDITEKSHTQSFSGFDSGVTMLDVNNDGYLDIYLCKAGSLKDDEARRNKLFVNQKDGTFKEESKKWGLDDPGYSTQIYQLDYDKDGDLDLYLVNHRYDFQNNNKISGDIQSKIEEITSDQLYRNDGTKYTNVTKESGLYNKTWGLAAAVSDFNEDGWDDIYISNDFLEPDQLLINQKDGTFKDEILSRIKHISTNSMGNDYADLNNDLFPDLITLDMLSENYARAKENMAAMSTKGFLEMVKIGYHHAYMANMLHFNTGDGLFQETGQLSGVTKTDWSWAPLLADFDNDGLKDIFITNGVDRDYTNQDARRKLKQVMAEGKSMKLQDVLNTFPSEKMENFIFKNTGDLSFAKKMKAWGLDQKVFSYGAAYADLDNDGDLDLITNNIEDQAGIYKNNADNNYLQIQLKGSEKNPFALGSKVFITTPENKQLQELHLTRGYKSSVSPTLHFGLGDVSQIDTLIVQWNDGKTTTLSNIKTNQRLIISYNKQATNQPLAINRAKNKKTAVDPVSLGIKYTHQENDFNDYSLQLLLPQKQATKGTKITVADVNGDNLDDFFVGNAQNAPAALYVQDKDGTFKATNLALWEKHAKYEDANAQFFDADGDGDQDLYVVSAGYNLDADSPLLQDRLYFNDGNGTFTYNPNALPKMLTSGKALTIADYDKDGDNDIFVGGNVVPGKYPLDPSSYLLKNNAGSFTNVTDVSKDLKNAGMVSDAAFSDYDNDGDLDLMLVGEWMKPTLFINTNGIFSAENELASFNKKEGWWFSVTQADFDKDGDIDYVLGNLGDNNKFHPSQDKPLFIYAKDFDNNGTFDVALSKINDGRLVPVRGKECSSEQNPFLLDKIQTYKQFAHLDMKDIYGEDKLKQAFKRTAYDFKSYYAENLGNGSFKLTPLPNQAQTGPTLASVATDINNDGNLDILGVGAIYDAEVETIRYDSNYGYVLLGDGAGNFTFDTQRKPLIDSDAKDITQITIHGEKYYMVVSNNKSLDIFKFEI